MSGQERILGIDFGTSNTAAAVLTPDGVHRIALEPGEETLPTAVFFDFDAQDMLIGRAAAQAMIEGRDGRFMRALKSILGTTLAREKRQFLNERLTLIEVIGRFLRDIRLRAEAETGQRFTRALSGRPVRFHSASETRNAQALEDLRAAYALAGFEAVEFLPEPEAAAFAASHGEQDKERLLIVDIGGGTSDFTVCERAGGETRIIASAGIRLGGTDFDRMLSLAHAMPLFGHGAKIGNLLGEGSHTAPRALFHDLASWEKIAFVYGRATLEEVRRWERLAEDPVLFERLGHILEMHLGHDVAYAVEAGKIAANRASAGMIDLSVVEKGLRAEIANHALQAALFESAGEIAACAGDVLSQAGCAPEAIDRVVFVGGSSLLGVVQARIGAMFPAARLETSEVFTAVVDGLALAAG
ncbi:Hsp70 family protein [Rhodalgimonas zhirmunskyi]|uniref:Hsp70 family protein n=1 Tax=Rhodalgimonas zhirmunskyi TaxID=2964767 RepID=A0AAJ1UA59_9RHOB|nr:Hsp70 family protein [Rhodoalgimonas zhirmunskyi]MDQ2095630.1 Hsp70 family protein [Rhodoalgimonas zhirmunskyi]